MGGHIRHRMRRGALLAALACTATLAGLRTAWAAEHLAHPLTVQRPRVIPPTPVVPSPLLPGAPIPWSGSPLLTPQTLQIADGETRFLAEGAAQARCPGDRIVFVPGVINAFRPTLPGDGAFMCHGDAVAEGFVGP